MKIRQVLEAKYVGNYNSFAVGWSEPSLEEWHLYYNVGRTHGHEGIYSRAEQIVVVAATQEEAVTELAEVAAFESATEFGDSWDYEPEDLIKKKHVSPEFLEMMGRELESMDNWDSYWPLGTREGLYG